MMKNYVDFTGEKTTYCTNEKGNGLFIYSKGCYSQILGTSQFKTFGVKDPIKKIKSFLIKRDESFYGCLIR